MSKILFAIWMEDNFGCICRITVDGQVYKRTKLSLNSRSFKVLGRARMLLNSFWQRKSLHNVCPRYLESNMHTSFAGLLFMNMGLVQSTVFTVGHFCKLLFVFPNSQLFGRY